MKLKMLQLFATLLIAYSLFSLPPYGSQLPTRDHCKGQMNADCNRHVMNCVPMESWHVHYLCSYHPPSRDADGIENEWWFCWRED